VESSGPQPHRLLAAAFGALDDAGVRWCLLRAEDDLAAPGGDVDVLMARGDAARAEAALASTGFARLPARGHGPHRFFLAYDRDDDAWLKLDVVTELAFGPSYALRSHAAAACLARRRRRNGVAVLDTADAFWCLLLHRLLDKGAIGPTAARLCALAADPRCATSPLALELDRRIASPGAAGRLIAAGRAGDAAALEALGRRLAGAWRRRERASGLPRRLAVAAGRRAAPVARARRGLTVALLGPDGAGKSTAAGGLARAFPFPVRTISMSPVPPRPVRGPRGAGFAVTVGGLLARWARAAGHRTRGRLVLFDRYPYDALLPPRRPLGRRGRLRRWAIGHACPPPDLTVALDAPGTILHARKHEHDPDVLEVERRAYAALAQRRGGAVLDATHDAERVRRDLTAAIWAAYRRRFART
jgi:thymidylate kinase